MKEIMKFEKKGDVFTILFNENNGRLLMELRGKRGMVDPIKHTQYGWGYQASKYGEIAKTLNGGKQDVVILHESAEEVGRIVEDWKKKKAEEAKAAAEAEIAEIKAGKKPIRVRYHDGEYLSGYMAFGHEAKLLVELGLAKEVSGWGTHVKSELVKALGEEFTYSQAVEFARPAMEEKARKKAEKEATRRAKFEEAARTGKPVELSRWTTGCNDPNEECDLDVVVEYAMPDGSVKTERHHTW